MKHVLERLNRNQIRKDRIAECRGIILAALLVCALIGAKS